LKSLGIDEHVLHSELFEKSVWKLWSILLLRKSHKQCRCLLMKAVELGRCNLLLYVSIFSLL